MHGRIMALDVGERTIGVALTDPEQLIASPFETLRRQSAPSDIEHLQRLIQSQNVIEIVVGLPRSLSGELGFQAERTLQFVALLRAATAVPVVTWDERFSTAEALQALLATGARRDRRQQLVDQVAASVILQSYLASRPRSGTDRLEDRGSLDG